MSIASVVVCRRSQHSLESEGIMLHWAAFLPIRAFPATFYEDYSHGYRSLRYDVDSHKLRAESRMLGTLQACPRQDTRRRPVPRPLLDGMRFRNAYDKFLAVE